MNAYTSEVGGEHIQLAVVDSVLYPSSDMELTTDVTNNYIASDDRDTTGHGSRILMILRAFAPKAVYNCYRVVAGDKEFRTSNFLKTMADIRDDNIDVVNISAGKGHVDCGGRCRICEAVEAVVSEGTVVVAGAGYLKSDGEYGVFCPARSRQSITVAMSESVCTASPEGMNQLNTGPDIFRPPGAYWATDTLDDPPYPGEIYCGGNRCSPYHTCENNKVDQYWYGNPNWESYVPEVAAPGHLPVNINEDGGFQLEPGTSYSTAVVSGAVTTVVSEVYPPIPSQQRISRLIESTSQSMDCGIVGKLDMEGLRDTML